MYTGDMMTVNVNLAGLPVRLILNVAKIVKIV